jgi:hypothetical protein
MSALEATPVIQEFAVQRVIYQAHTSRTGNTSVKVVYYVEGLQTFFEYVSVEGGNLRAKRGRDWYRLRSKMRGEPPDDNSDLLELCPELRVPAMIQVVVNRQYPEIIGVAF